MSFKTLVFSILSFTLGVAAVAMTTTASSSTAPDRAADAAAIRAHIESIFQAFIDGDEKKIYDTHSEDWRGLLEGYPAPIKGIDEYMRANGIDWPKAANAPKAKPYHPAGTTYKIDDFDVHFYTPDLAVVNFLGGFEGKEGNTRVALRRFRIMDIYARRKGSWIQVASHTAIDPDWRARRLSQPATITPEMREQILAQREAVWRAWFANDRAALEKLIPPEAIAINDGDPAWADRAAIFAGAKAFAEGGGKLVRLEFPKTEIQVYGNTVLIYTTYVYETDVNGKRSTSSGRGTEMFVRRGDELVNVGWHLDSFKE